MPRIPGIASTVRLRAVATSIALVGGGALIAGCAGGGGVASAPVPATELEWRALASPRPEPVTGAPRVALAGVELLTAPSWSAESPVSISLGITELVAAGLLRRADVRFVERRRFAAAADAERAGRARPRGAPAAGVSEGAELVATVVVGSLSESQWTVEVRLADAATGAVRATARSLVPSGADPVALARQAVRGILSALGETGRLPTWSDPFPAAAPTDFTPSGVSQSAFRDFLAGLAAEEVWAWERARVAYQSAAGRTGFVEAGAALARTARLRLGGTLGESG